MCARACGEEDRCRECHIAVLARFVRCGIPTRDTHPIVIDVGMGGTGLDWPILDGNHRLFAAAIKGVEHVAVEVMGAEDEIVRVLIDGVAD